jgi:hypothetical protein
MSERAAVVPSADRSLSVGIRVAIPDGGFGRQLTVIQHWLDENAGLQGYRVEPDADGAGRVALFLFADVGVARAFIGRFACGIAGARDMRRQQLG